MTIPELYLLAFGIGVVSGLRAFSAPAIVCWAARVGWLHLQSTPAAFMGSAIAAYSFGLLALGELVGDKLPQVPSRKSPGPLAARMVLGGLSGAALFLSAGAPMAVGVVTGALGGAAGAFGGYEMRMRSVRALAAPDFVVALAEDALAIGTGVFIVSRLRF